MDSGVVQVREYQLSTDLALTYQLGWGSKMIPEQPGQYGTRYALTCEFHPSSDGEIVPLAPAEAVRARDAHQDMLKQFAVRCDMPYEMLKVLDWAGDCCEGSPEHPACRLPNGKFRSNDSSSLTTWNANEARRWESELYHSVMQCELSVVNIAGIPRALCQRCLASSKGEVYPVRRRQAA